MVQVSADHRLGLELLQVGMDWYRLVQISADAAAALKQIMLNLYRS